MSTDTPAAMVQRPPMKKIISWAFYDWANHAFATTVLASFFPIFYKSYWRPDVPATQSTYELGMFNSGAGLVLALLAPILGAIADRGGVKKRFLLFFASIGIVASAGLHFVGYGNYQVAGLVFMIGIIGYLGANVFSDSMLVDMARGRSTDRISALGFAMGYLGGGLLFAFNVFLTLKPELFGIADKASAVRASFLIVAGWWLFFTLPLILNVPEPKVVNRAPMRDAIGAGLRQLRETFRHVRTLKPVMLFLLAYWLYIDGVNTIVVMAVDYGASLKFSTDSLIKALLIVQFVGFPAAIAFGRLGDKIGTRAGIYVGLAVYCFVTFWGAYMTSEKEFYGLAIAIGLVQGGVQSLSRAFYARLIPQDRVTEFFGFYNMLGRFATLIGPMLMGVAGKLTGNSRASILALSLLFFAGAIVLLFVKAGDADQSQRA
ncbi:MAG: MFS transporter [Candidatus Sumerlaeaceae bacterium]